MVDVTKETAFFRHSRTDTHMKAGTACTSPEPSQATQEAHSERGGRLAIPFLAEKLLASDGLWENERIVFKMWLLVG